jgi:hypothetical protein
VTLPGFEGLGVDYLAMTVVGEGDDVFGGSSEAVGDCGGVACVY